jgi:hypothetical protein
MKQITAAIRVIAISLVILVAVGLPLYLYFSVLLGAGQTSFP